MTRAATQWNSPLPRAQLGGEGSVRGTLWLVRSPKGHPLTPALSPGNARGEGVSETTATTHLKSPLLRAQLGGEGWVRGALWPGRSLKVQKHPLTPALSPGNARGEGVSKTTATTHLKSHLPQAQLGGEGWVRGTLWPVRSLKGRPLTSALSPGNARGEGVSKTTATTHLKSPLLRAQLGGEGVSGSPASTQLQSPSSRVPPGKERLTHTGHLYL